MNYKVDKIMNLFECYAKWAETDFKTFEATDKELISNLIALVRKDVYDNDTLLKILKCIWEGPHSICTSDVMKYISDLENNNGRFYLLY